MIEAVRVPEVVEGPGLLLRTWRAGDVDDLSHAVERNVEHLRPWMSWVATEPLDRTLRLDLIESWATEWAAAGSAIYGAFNEGGVIGGCGLHRRRGPAGLEIGYWVDKDHLRQGVATEMTRLLTTAAFAVAGVTFVEIHHDRANIASAGVPRRLGYAFIGETPDEVEAPGEAGVDWGWRMESANWRGWLEEGP